MDVWILIGIVAAVKLPIAALMLWLPMRSDQRALPPRAGASEDRGDEDGGTGSGPPERERPRSPLPRRGPHGEPPPASPPRVRGPGRREPVARPGAPALGAR
jgi:hypothetical protein